MSTIYLCIGVQNRLILLNTRVGSIHTFKNKIIENVNQVIQNKMTMTLTNSKKKRH